MADYVSPPPTIAFGAEVTSEFLNELSGNEPQIFDFPAYSLSGTLNATDLFQSAFVVPSDSMGDHRQMLIYAKGTLKNSTGGNEAAPAFSVVYGADTLIDSGLGPNLNSGATLGYFQLLVRIIQNGATNAQVVVMDGYFGDKDDVSDFDTGAGTYTYFNASPKGGQIYGWNNTTVDMNAGAILAFNARCAASSGNYIVALEVGKAWIL